MLCEGDGARRRDGPVCDERPVVGRRRRPVRRHDGRRPVGEDGGVGGRLRQERGQVVLVGQRRLLVPGGVGPKPLGRAQRDLFALGDHAEKVAVANHGDDTGQRQHERGVQRRERRAAGRRPHHAAVQHVVEVQVMHVARSPGELVRQVDSRIRRCPPRGSPSRVSVWRHRWRAGPAPSRPRAPSSWLRRRRRR